MILQKVCAGCRVLFALPVVIVLFAILAGCTVGGTTTPPSASLAQSNPGEQPTSGSESALATGSSVKVALLLPLSARGSSAQVARSLKQSGELALFEMDRPEVLLFTKDTKGTAEGARAAAREAISSGAELIIGPLFAKSVAAAAEVSRASNVPMIAFSNDRTVAGDGVFLLSFLPGDEMRRIIEHATRQGRRNFAALVPEGAYGQIMARAIDDSIRRTGANLTHVASYPPDANGMLKPVKATKRALQAAKLQGRPIDSLIVAAGPESLPTLATLFPYQDIDTSQLQLIGTREWDFAGLGQQDVYIGGWYAAPDPDGWRDFSKRYTRTYGAAPPRIASVAYDAVSLAISLSSNAPGQRFTARNLTRPSGFAGVDGLFRLTNAGTAQRGFAVLEAQRFGPRVIDPAPSVFGPTQYSSLPSSTN